MEKETEVDWTKPEAKKLFRRVRLQGLSNDDIRRIIADADTPQAAFDRLTEIADPRRVCPKTPKPPRTSANSTRMKRLRWTRFWLASFRRIQPCERLPSHWRVGPVVNLKCGDIAISGGSAQL